jgi:hypothetical protein
MSKLQELLEARFQANGDLAHDSQMLFLRGIFTEGYNAGLTEGIEIGHSHWEDPFTTNHDRNI